MLGRVLNGGKMLSRTLLCTLCCSIIIVPNSRREEHLTVSLDRDVTESVQVEVWQYRAEFDVHRSGEKWQVHICDRGAFIMRKRQF